MKPPKYGLKLSLGPFSGAVHPDYHTPRFLEAVAECRGLLSSPSSRILLDRRNRVAATAVPVSEGRRVEAVIKEFRVSGFKKLKTLVGRGKAAKAWRGASACAVRHVPTPSPIVFLERRSRGLVVESYFLAEYIRDAREIRALLQTLSGEDLSSLLSALARFLAFCHDRGILHRDLSDGNILVQTGGKGEYAFWLIDTNRIRLRRTISLPSRIRNLARLGIPPSSRDHFLRLYLGEKGGRYFVRLWYRLNKNAYAGFVAFKKKLRLRKIAEALRIQ